MNLAILFAIAAVLVLVAFLLARRSRPDALGDFQRQIDALSPQARKSVVDQVHQLEQTEPNEPADVNPEETENPNGS
jgi:hypothetical protein